MAIYSDRKIAIYEAKLVMETGHYDDAVDMMKRVAKLDLELTAEERNLLAEGYGNLIKSKGAALRILTSIQQRSKGDQFKVAQNDRYIEKVGDRYLVGDHLWLCADKIKTKSDMRKKLGLVSLKIYEMATQLADKNELYMADPIPLALCLKHSVVHRELPYDLSKGCEIAQRAYDRATGAGLSSLNGEALAKNNKILLELKEKISKWKGSVVKLDVCSAGCFSHRIASCEASTVEFQPNAVISNMDDDDVVPRDQNAAKKDGSEGAANDTSL
ncbi:hypothetical protein C2S53_006915 [Perilla frutescens var. hirtella]|uniref:14-3-3 domain-containing protein n=1 Tax=Perilla frutescens var. hirtella TaxID=608512 RepID=A0AAD4JEP9_PERFH|nr:hypothetical protein C2S53_006915 [Perilla frutescens var. hirtella]